MPMSGQDLTLELCNPGAVCVTRFERVPCTILNKDFNPNNIRSYRQKEFSPAGNLPNNVSLVVIQIRTRRTNTLVEVLTPAGDTRWVTLKGLRFPCDESLQEILSRAPIPDNTVKKPKKVPSNLPKNWYIPS